MRERCILLAVAISLAYTVARSIEAKVFRASSVPVKKIVQDFIYVFLSSLVTLFVATYLDGPISYFLSIVANKPIMHQGPAAVNIMPPDW